MALLNCNPLQRTENALIHLAENLAGKWGIYPNLGIGEPSPDGSITKYESMDKFVVVMEKAIEMGASVLGACCGSSPEHIKNLCSLSLSKWTLCSFFSFLSPVSFFHDQTRFQNITGNSTCHHRTHWRTYPNLPGLDVWYSRTHYFEQLLPSCKKIIGMGKIESWV